MSLKDQQGSALATVLIMITVLTVLSGVLFAAFTLHHRLARRDFNRLQAFYYAEAGIYKALWYLSGNDELDWFWRPDKQDISISNNQTAQISVKERGGFLEIFSSAQYNNQKRKLQVLVGQKMPDQFNQAIILGGKDFPLVVTGSNRIVGDVTVGKRGVKQGSIKGSKFTGRKLVEGEIHKVSPPQMPTFDATLFHRSMQNFRDLLANIPDSSSTDFDSVGLSDSSGRNILYLQEEWDSSVLADSLVKGVMTIVSEGDLQLSGSFRFMNQVVIVSLGKIVITDSVLLNDAVVYSETGISVSGNAKGAMQLLSPGDIEVSEQASLEYPSVLFTTGQLLENRWTGSIKIADSAKIAGVLILPDSRPDSLKNLPRDTRVVVESGAHVTGFIYSTNHTTIQGRVYGLVVADHFYLYESPTTYINWLKDAYIDRRKLGSGFMLPLMFTKKRSLEIVSWN